MSNTINRKGFTLIELLVVVLIIGIMSGIAMPQYRRSIERTRVAEALTLMRAIYDSCERLAWEKGDKSCAEGLAHNNVTIKKLDVTFKGTFDGDFKIVTNNFSYQLLKTDGKVYAVPQRGKHAGEEVQIVFDGARFVCKGTSGSSACDEWGAVTWNEGIKETSNQGTNDGWDTGDDDDFIDDKPEDLDCSNGGSSCLGDDDDDINFDSW